MRSDLLIGFWAMHVAVLLVPGSNVMLVMSYGLSGSRKEAIVAAMGIATGTLLWCLAASSGLALFLRLVPGVTPILGAAAAAYLFHVAWQMLRSGHGGQVDPPAQTRGAYVAGLLSSLSNVKSGLFFASAFATPLASEPGMSGILGLVAAVNSLAWHLGLALFFSAFDFLRRPGYRRGMHFVAASGLFALAALAMIQALEGIPAAMRPGCQACAGSAMPPTTWLKPPST